jgi:hypothetical protein
MKLARGYEVSEGIFDSLHDIRRKMNEVGHAGMD